MGYLQIAAAVLTLVVELFKWWREKDAERKANRNETIEQIKVAIKERDSAKYTYALERAKRV